MLQLLINALLTCRLFVIITWSSQMNWQVGLDLSMIPEFSETLLFLPLLETSFPQITTSLGMGATHLWGIDVEQVFFCYEQYVYFQLYRAIFNFLLFTFQFVRYFALPLILHVIISGWICSIQIVSQLHCHHYIQCSIQYKSSILPFWGSKYII